MNIGSYGAMPGITALRQTAEKVIVFGRDSDLLYQNQAVISSTAVDAGNTPTSTLRAGLVMGRKTSDGKLYAWNPDAVDGTELYAGVLLRDIGTLGMDGIAEDKYGHVLRRGPIKASELLIEGVAFASSTAEQLCRRQMVAAGCELDDEVVSKANFGGLPAREVAKSANYTVLEADNGTLFTTEGAVGQVTFTLPALQAGLAYEFLNLVDQNMVIASAAGDDIVWTNDAAADSLTFGTTSQKIGAHVQLFTNAAGTKWYVRNLSTATITPAT